MDATLALGGSITIVCALEDEAQAFGYKANPGGLSPAKQVQCNLPRSIVLARIVHGESPSLGSSVEGLNGGRFLGFPVGFRGAEPAGTVVPGLTNGIVELELSSNMPFAVVGILTTSPREV